MISQANPEKLVSLSDKSWDRQQLKRRTQKVLSREIGFVPNPLFREMDANGQWREELQSASTETSALPTSPARRTRLPAHLEQICAAPLLTASEERELFRRMNYLKYRANAIRSTLHPNQPSRRKLEEIVRLLARADQLRNRIVSANTRLVASIAKKFVTEQNPFDDLLSEGINALLKAVEKFDFDRGFRFSTYATMVIRREFYSLIRRAQRDRLRYATGTKDVFEDQIDPDGTAATSESDLRSLNRQMSKLISRLDEREQFIVKARYGFIDLGMKPTYLGLGKKLGVSKERVRQILERAMSKMRERASELRLNDVAESLFS